MAREKITITLRCIIDSRVITLRFNCRKYFGVHTFSSTQVALELPKMAALDMMNFRFLAAPASALEASRNVLNFLRTSKPLKKSLTAKEAVDLSHLVHDEHSGVEAVMSFDHCIIPYAVKEINIRTRILFLCEWHMNRAPSNQNQSKGLI